MKKEFYDKPFYVITNYIIGFFLGSIYLAVCNILLLLYFVFIGTSQNNLNLFLLFIFLIPLGPSLGALYSTNAKLMREKDISFSSYFWNSYKNNFVSHLKPWLIELIMFTLLLIDYYRTSQNRFHIIFAVLLLITFLLVLFTLPINSRFQLKLKDLFIVSLYYMIKKFPITGLKIIILGLVYLLCQKAAIISLIFVPSILCFILYFYDKAIFIDLESRLQVSEDKHLPIKKCYYN